jgi:hypothetical protein
LDPSTGEVSGFAGGLQTPIALEVSKAGELYYLSRDSSDGTASVGKIATPPATRHYQEFRGAVVGQRPTLRFAPDLTRQKRVIIHLGGRIIPDGITPDLGRVHPGNIRRTRRTGDGGWGRR